MSGEKKKERTVSKKKRKEKTVRGFCPDCYDVARTNSGCTACGCNHCPYHSDQHDGCAGGCSEE